MLSEHLQGLEKDWITILDQTETATQQAVLDKVEVKATELAAAFYRQMLAQNEASQYLDNQVVQERLSASMQHWIIDLFTLRSAQDDLKPLVERQVQIGEVHGRVDIPVHLVLRGGRVLKQTFSELFNPALTEFQFFGRMVDIALEVMSIAYHKNHERNTRNEEAYRLFSITQNIGREKEFQRAALLDWENELLFEQATGQPGGKLLRIAQAEFGLWFRHKGLHAFEGAPECAQVIEQMAYIDDTLLPELEREDQHRIDSIRSLRAALKTILFCIDSLFQRSGELESGKDVLTRLLNRKFLPAVMTKQLTLARQRNEQYAVLAIDVDYFKRINDEYGHDNGDLVLQQLAVILTDSIRSGDYSFRLGGEEFMVLLVDVDQALALSIAEKIRKNIAQDIFRLQGDKQLNVTVSIGVSVYSGHPDYQYDLQCADKALYQAKKQGRNCVVNWEH